jgi:PAS domain S-box-containing protein
MMPGNGQFAGAHRSGVSPLARRLVLATVAISTAIAIFATALQLYLHYRRDVANIDAMLAHVEGFHVPTLSSALREVDRDELQATVDGIARLPDIAHVSVLDTERPRAQSDARRAAKPRIHDFPLEYTEQDRRLPIGTLRVVVDMAGVYRRLVTSLWIILASNALKTGVVAVFLLWLFHRLVTRHLTAIAGYASRLGFANWAAPPVLDRHKTAGAPCDELDDVVNALARMRADLKNAVDALRKSEERYRLLCDNGNDVILLLDATSGRILDVNSQARRQYGYSGDELCAMTIQDLGLPRDAQRISTLLQCIPRDGTAVFEAQIRARDGRATPAEISGRSVIVDGKPLLVAVVRDLTDRKKAEDTLRKLSSAVEQSPNSIIITNTAGVIEYVNPAFVAKTGFGLNESIGNTPRLIRSEHTRREQIEELWNTLLAGQPWRGELLNVRKDGRVFWELVAIWPLKDAAGTVTHYLGIQTDITEQKAREDEIRRLNAELETRVRERTAELETANRELEAFSYSVSHDLRAPLRAVDGYSRALDEQFGATLAPSAREYLARVRSATQRMGGLIDDILGLSRVSRADLRREPIDLSELVRETASELARAEPARSVAVNIAPDLHVDGDASLLRIALQNLLGNAWKYTRRAREARIDVGATESKGLRCFFVRDNGAGFDMRYAGRLFAPFQRLHESHEFEGSGVGLATVARIVHRHGGEVWAEAEVDRGATFYFTLGESAATRN